MFKICSITSNTTYKKVILNLRSNLTSQLIIAHSINYPFVMINASNLLGRHGLSGDPKGKSQTGNRYGERGAHSMSLLLPIHLRNVSVSHLRKLAA